MEDEITFTKMDNLIVLDERKMKKEIKDWHLMRWHNEPEAKRAVLDFVQYVRKWKKVYFFKIERGRGEE